ncbi:diaminopimelate epimerase [Cloacibacillus porcorum]|uniref:diaminopimelate epimerase n=1 Tax=Cloacibacillus porcorum TaxID=1197717 RepID=UPI0023F45805|nr:diaminopimelate epimerase [Cloacibacillus porcorum]MDD7649902.1 diaminopimelate epimerase [Cloacibacillus porcorum]MDY4092153.1 diaminopimelate epimerase [Cloacibacillus porcorum]
MIECVKMNGNGNDFLVLDNMALRYDTEFLSNLAAKACRRRQAVGADGLVVAEPSAAADFKMRIFNPDGTEGEMCGNGARCVSRFALDYGIAKTGELTFETLGGMVRAVVDGGLMTMDLAPVSLRGMVTDGRLCVGEDEFEYSFITVGVPHCVIFERERNRRFEEYAPVGRAIRRRSDLFPQGTHVNFAVMCGEADTIDIMTYERGVEDMTLSCGTGSVASAIVSWLSGRTGPDVRVKNPGGVNGVSLLRSENGDILPKLEGRAVAVAEISIMPEALL